MLTSQEIFDRVALHLLTQNAKSQVPRPGHLINGDISTMCAYRGTNGLKCAVGCLIPDDAYIPFMEGKALNASYMVDKIEALNIALYGSAEYNLLAYLQLVHDGYYIISWRDELIKTASHYKISDAVVRNFTKDNSNEQKE